MDTDLLRQRRNIIGISVILIIFDFAKVEITKISILGTELLIGNAQILMIFAWILWSYFLLRYYQYWTINRNRSIRNAFMKRLDIYARTYTKAVAMQDSLGGYYDNYKISRTGLATWTYTLEGFNVVSGKNQPGPIKSLPAWRLALWSIRSAAYVCIQTPHATDHILPFLLAISAPTITLLINFECL